MGLLQDLILVHYGREPVTSVKAAGQGRHTRAWQVGKPDGLWVSVEGEDDWPSWCRDNDFELPSLAVATRVILKPDAKVLLLSNTDQLRNFRDLFKTRLLPQLPQDQIAWEDVARIYGGVVIAPYVWSLRLARGFSWYYGWDCASGCLWDPDVVDRLEPHVLREAAA